MKNLKLSISILALLIAGHISKAQIQDSIKSEEATMMLICKPLPIPPEKRPLIIIYIKDQRFILPSDSLTKNIDPGWIEGLKIFKDSKETAKYGPKGVNGVIFLTIKEENQRDALEVINKFPVTSSK